MEFICLPPHSDWPEVEPFRMKLRHSVERFLTITESSWKPVIKVDGEISRILDESDVELLPDGRSEKIIFLGCSSQDGLSVSLCSPVNFQNVCGQITVGAELVHRRHNIDQEAEYQRWPKREEEVKCQVLSLTIPTDFDGSSLMKFAGYRFGMNVDRIVYLDEKEHSVDLQPWEKVGDTIKIGQSSRPLSMRIVGDVSGKVSPKNSFFVSDLGECRFSDESRNVDHIFIFTWITCCYWISSTKRRCQIISQSQDWDFGWNK